MRSQRYRNLTILLLVFYLLSHVFTLYHAMAHCGQRETIEEMITTREEALRLAQENLDTLNDEGYLEQLKERGRAYMLAGLVGGGIAGWFFGPGAVIGAVTGAISLGITGAIITISSHYNDVEDAEAEVSNREADLAQAQQWLYECENGTLCGTCWNQGGACNDCDR